jgi:hypothetical protein
MAFQFPSDLEPHVRSLLALINTGYRHESREWSNIGHSWVSHNGVYGHACHTLFKLVEIHTSQDVSDLFQEKFDQCLEGSEDLFKATITLLESCITQDQSETVQS